MLGSMDSALPPKSDRPVSLRKPLRQLSLGQDPLPASPLISTRNLVPGLSDSVVKLDRLGKGATSNVFRAVHAASLKMVALKEVTVSTDADRRAVRTEMRALRTQRSPLLKDTFTTELASCPRIVDYYGSVNRDNGNACMAVEYVAGGSLGSWLESGCKCPEAWIAHIAHQALEALDFVHSRGRMHRDVKPANILITREGDIKLADFGAAGVENSSRMVGTQRFMAPERLKGHPATAQSDLWSFGLSLATAALGDCFISQASTEFEQLDLAGSAGSSVKEATGLSAELRYFLRQCLSKDPARRPALRELMRHPFLKQRKDWTRKCPEVALTLRENKRRQREKPTALSTEAVLSAICEARADDDLVDARIDPAIAADLAYELGMPTEKLVRIVYRRTLHIIQQRGGGAVGIIDSGRENDEFDESTSGHRGRLDGGIVNSSGGRNQHRRYHAQGKQDDGEASTRSRDGSSRSGPASVRSGHGSFSMAETISVSTGLGGDSIAYCFNSDDCLSPTRSPSRESSLEEVRVIVEAAPSVTLENYSDSDGSNARHTSRPLVTPRNRTTTVGGTGVCAASTVSIKSGSSRRRSSRKATEIPAAVRLTPHKRRGERKAAQTKRRESTSQADGPRRSRDGPERPNVTALQMEKDSTEVSTESQAKGDTSAIRAKQTSAGASPEFRAVHTILSARPSRGQQEGGVVGNGRTWQLREIKETSLSTELRPPPSRTSVRPMQEVFRIADEMKAQIRVRDRVYRLRVYARCFSGREAVQWMIDGAHASSVKEAETLGNEMMKHSVFQHILNSQLFEDSSVYYQFTDGETLPPPARGSNRIRQVARVWGGHVARRFVLSSSPGSRSGGGTKADGIVGVVENGKGRSPSSESRPSATKSTAAKSGVQAVDGARVSSFRQPTARRKDKQTQPAKHPHAHTTGRGNQRRRRKASGATRSQLRRFSSSMSTVTMPETPH